MPLPRLIRRAAGAADANAREYAKRTLVGEPPEQAAAAVGAPLEVLATHPAAKALERAIDPREAELLRDSELAAARRALESREGRVAWLTGIMTGAVKFEGAFGNLKEFPPAAKIAAGRLLMQMHGDLAIKHQIELTEKAVVVFHIPDNGRLPADVVDAVEGA